METFTIWSLRNGNNCTLQYCRVAEEAEEVQLEQSHVGSKASLPGYIRFNLRLSEQWEW